MDLSTPTVGTRALVEGALLASVAVILALAGVYLPLLGPFVTFTWPVPIIVIHLRRGLRLALLTLAVTGAIVAMAVGLLQAVGIVATFGLLGIAFGEAFSRRLSPTMTLLVGAAASLVSTLVTLGLVILLFRQNPLALFGRLLEESFTQAIALYERFGIGQAQLEMIVAMREQVSVILSTLFPSLLVGAAVLSAALNYWVARLVLARLGHPTEPFPAFRAWRLPRALALVYVVSIGLLLAPRWLPWPGPEAVGSNGLVIANWAFLVQGMAVGYFYLERWRVARALRIFLLGYAAFVPLLMQLLVLTGLVDLFFDLRRLDATAGPAPEKVPEKESGAPDPAPRPARGRRGAR